MRESTIKLSQGEAIFFCVALHAEASPLIHHYSLKQDLTSHKFPVYRSKSIYLVISGVGKLNAAIALSYLLTREVLPRNAYVCNIGLAGSISSTDLGKMYLVHKVCDVAACIDYYPDIPKKHALPETVLYTYEQPVYGKPKGLDIGLVDMEGAGFFAAAKCYVSPHQIFLLKCVSDFLQPIADFKKLAVELMQEQVEYIDEFVRYILALPKRANYEAKDADIKKISLAFSLTASEEIQLRELLKSYYLLRKKELVQLFLQKGDLLVKDLAKKEKKKLFRELCESAYQEITTLPG